MVKYTGAVAVLAAGIALLILAYSSGGADTGSTRETDMEIKSGRFKEGDTVPTQYTCDGEDVNPFLEFKNVPDEAQSLVLIVDDSDATRGGRFTHWLVWNIPASTTYIPEDSVPDGAVEGKNDFGNLGYGGPCPPRGAKPHRYVFTLSALDAELSLKEGATRTELEVALEGHDIARTTLTGKYSR